MNDDAPDDFAARSAVGAPPELTAETDPEISRMLEASGIKKDAPREVPLDLDPETRQELLGQEDSRKRVVVDPPAQWATEDAEEPWALWTKQLAGLGEIPVTDEDKTMFLKAAMCDEEVQLPIELHGMEGKPVMVRSLSNRLLRALAMAMGKDGDEGAFRDLSVWASRLQYYSVLMQYAGYGPAEESLLPDDVKNRPVAEICDWLRENVDTVLADMSGPRYMLVVQAIRVFEAKMARLKEGLVNGDFFGTAGTSS